MTTLRTMPVSRMLNFAVTVPVPHTDMVPCSCFKSSATSLFAALAASFFVGGAVSADIFSWVAPSSALPDVDEEEEPEPDAAPPSLNGNVTGIAFNDGPNLSATSFCLRQAPT